MLGINSCTYSFTGAEDVFIPPSGVSGVSVNAIGGAGGNESPGDGNSPTYSGGTAVHVMVGVISVSPGASYYVNVGGNGLMGTQSLCGRQALSRGYNGGGTASECGPGSGGGASVVSSDSPTTAAGVLVVAAGGGGAGEYGGDAANGNTADGGAGPNCGGQPDGGGGRTTTTGGAVVVGSYGSGTGGTSLKGGNGETADGYGAGGGAGYYGGGGGGMSDVMIYCGGPGGAGSSFAVSGTPTYTPDSSGVPEIVISWSPTVAMATGLHVQVARGWTIVTWRSAAHVLGFNVYQGPNKLNRTLVASASQRYVFRVHTVVRHPVLRPVTQR